MTAVHQNDIWGEKTNILNRYLIYLLKSFISSVCKLQVVCNLLESRSPPGIFECIDEISIIYAKVGRIVNLQVVFNLLENRSPPGVFVCIDKISIIYAKIGRIVNLQVVFNLLEYRSPPGIFECIDEMQYHLCQGWTNLQVVCNLL